MGFRLSEWLGLVAEARWYAVTKSGLATLCASERDALESAASFDVSYPHSAPHRAVLLGDVAAERDCRTCAHYLPHHRAGVMHCTSALRCVGGDRHCKAGSVRQWEAAPLSPAPF